MAQRRAVWTAWVVGGLAVTVAGAQPAADDQGLGDLVGLRVMLGGQTAQSTPWAGTLSVTPGRLVTVEGERFQGQDKVETTGQFSFSTHRRQLTGAQARRQQGQVQPFEPNGFRLTVADTTPESRLTLHAGDRDVTAPLAEVLAQGLNRPRFGIHIEALAPAQRVTAGQDYDDDPAAAVAPDGTIYAAFVRFTPAEAYRQRVQPTATPKSFAGLATPPGGDQLWLVSHAAGRWGEPQPVTEKGLDLYRPAVAVDGQGRPWVFWSQHVDADATFTSGDWELFARCLTSPAGPAIRLTTAAGADVFPSAGTDSSGRVWVAWMGFRQHVARILVTTQQGDGFAPETELAGEPRDNWIPRLTTSADGQVAVVWDTYRKGDFDVYARVWREGQWGEPLPVATLLNGELNADAAYDRAGRLWVAYEVTPPAWGKDFGYTVKGKGVPLYNDRRTELKVLVDGHWQAPKQSVNEAWPTRRTARAAQGSPMAALPRLVVDGGGHVWLTARLKVGQRAGTVGTVWTDWATCYSGAKWTAAVEVTHSDGTLDKRPVLVPGKSGGWLELLSSDGREAQAAGRKLPAGAVIDQLYCAALRSTAPVAEPQLEPTTAGQATPAESTEVTDVQRVRRTVLDLNGRPLHIARGEFHRHTEISPDGGGDGTLLDMWRYALDCADLDWIGNGDHDNGNGRETTWWRIQKTTNIFSDPPRFLPMFTYERSVGYPDGHRNVMFAHRGIRTLPRMQGGLGKALDQEPADAARPHTPDSQMLFAYLKEFGGICASHTSGTDMGTDWRDNGGEAEPAVEIFQGDRQNYERAGAPRSNTATDSAGGYRPLGYVNRALQKGYRLGFECSSDHISTHISYCNVLVDGPSRESLLQAISARRLYGSTDNIVGDYRCQADGRDHVMGEEFTSSAAPRLKLKIVGTQPLARVTIIRDNEVVYETEPRTATVDLEWQETKPQTGRTSYYYVRGEQTDGELVWLSPMWIAVK